MTEQIKLSAVTETPFSKRYLAAGALGRAVGTRLRKTGSEKKAPLTLKAADLVMSRLSRSIEPLNDEERTKIKEVISPTKLWHGTGRYQYRDGKVTDVLDFIAKNGKLQPQFDDIDFTGPMESLSLAPSRMYSRAYADMHGKGAAEPERHGSSMFWAWTFLADIGIEAMKESKVWTKEGRTSSRSHFAQSGAQDWYKKVRGTYSGTMALFRKGSDIEGNYPILFGIKDGMVEPAVTSKSIAIHEVRSQNSLSLEQAITHIEVPRHQVENTQHLLESYGQNVPVIAIEDAERYVADLPFTELVSGGIV